MSLPTPLPVPATPVEQPAPTSHPEGEVTLIRAAIEAARLKVENVLENPLASYKDQFEALSEEAKNGSTWEQVSARLSANPEKLEKAKKMQGGGQIFYIAPDGTIYFKDKGVEPVMYVVDTTTKEMMAIYDRDAEAMRVATEEIGKSRVKWQAEGWNRGRHLRLEGRQALDWASGEEIEAEMAKDGYKLFEYDGHFDAIAHHDVFGPLMHHAAVANGDKNGNLFVASANRSENRWSWLKKGLVADFRVMGQYVHILERSLDERGMENFGVVRRLEI